MSLNRRTSWLAAGLLAFLMASTAWSQDLQIFAPFAQDQFGGGPRAKEGPFFSFDYLRYTISAPEETTIGYPDLTRLVYYTPDRSTIQSNTHDTGFLGAHWTDGQRIQFGDVCGHGGWIFGITSIMSQTQETAFSAMDMTVQDLEYGDPARKHLEGYVAFPGGEDDDATYTDFVLRDLPLYFDDVKVENRIKNWGVEGMFIHRFHPLRNAGIFEIFMGVRYMQFNEKFSVDARGERFYYASGDDGLPVGPRSVLGDSYWETESQNHILGPQIAARYFKTAGRWTFSTEGRFLAGFNFQNLRQQGTLGTKLKDPFPVSDLYPDLTYDTPLAADTWYPYIPLTMTTTSFRHSAHENEWSPAVEVRLEARYQVTKVVSMKFGWDLFWIDGIARSSNLVDYTLSEQSIMGLRLSENRQDLLMQGWTIGFELNR